MAQDGILMPFGCRDAKISSLTVDSTVSLTYGTAYDVPGMQSISFKPDFLSKELRGDDCILDRYSKIEAVSGSIKHAKVSFYVLGILLGGTANISTSGSTPNEKMSYVAHGNDTPSYWKLEAQIAYKGGDDTAGGDMHLTLHKAKVTSFSQEYQSDDYAVISFDWQAIPTTYDDHLFTLEENETAVAISAGAADTTPPTCTVVPADTATGVTVGANVVWTFSEALQTASVNTSSVFLIKSDGTNVAGAVTLVNNGASTTVTFNPNASLASAAEMIGICTTNVRDTAGNALAAPSITNFTVES